jgi:hypothetical protein
MKLLNMNVHGMCEIKDPIYKFCWTYMYLKCPEQNITIHHINVHTIPPRTLLTYFQALLFQLNIQMIHFFYCFWSLNVFEILMDTVPFMDHTTLIISVRSIFKMDRSIIVFLSSWKYFIRYIFKGTPLRIFDMTGLEIFFWDYYSILCRSILITYVQNFRWLARSIFPE